MMPPDRGLPADRPASRRDSPIEPPTDTLAEGETGSSAEPGAGGAARFPINALLAGRYRLRRFLGQGGLGQVFAAEDLELGVPVALKVLRPELSADRRFVALLRREVQLARRVTHPNVCRIYDLILTPAETGDQDGAPSLELVSMEMLPGGSLRDLLRDAGPLPPARVLGLGRQVAAALAAAHDAGIVHGDLKPSNVLLGAPDGGGPGVRAVVSDFGMARSLDRAGGAAEPAPRGGTAAYMAPEQARGEAAGPASDVYALGLVLAEAITGERDGDGPGAAVAALDGDGAERDLLRRVLVRCLAPDLGDRFPDGGAVAAALGAAPPPGRRWRASLAVAAGLMLAAASVAGLLWWTTGAGTEGTPAAGAGNAAVSTEETAVDAAATTPARLAILDLTDRTGRDDLGWLGAAVAALLEAELTGGHSLRTLPRGYLPEIAGHLGTADPTRWRPVARWLLRGSVDGRPGGGILLRTELVDTVSGETLVEIEERLAEAAELYGAVSRIATALRPSLGLAELSAEERALLAATLPASFATFGHFSRGGAAYAADDLPAAVRHFEAALEIEPSFAPARAALARAVGELGDYRRAAREAAAAVAAADGLPREEELAIRALAEELADRPREAIEIYRALWTLFPEKSRYGLELARLHDRVGEPEEALRLLDRVTPADERDEPAALLIAASAHGALSDYAAQAETARRAEDRALALGLDAFAAEAALHRAQAAQELGDLGAASAACREAEAHLGSVTQPQLRAEASQQLGWVLHRGGELAAAERLMRRTIADFEAIGNPGSAALVRNDLSLVLADLGRLEEARGAGERALSAVRTAEDAQALRSVLSNLGGILVSLGELDAGEARLTEALELARGTGSREGVAAALNNLADAQIRRGRLLEARTNLERALPIAEEMNARPGIGYIAYNLAWLDLEDLRLESARARLRRVLAIGRETGYAGLEGHALEGLGRAALLDGRWDEASSRLTAARDLRRGLEDTLGVAAADLYLGELALWTGDLDRAAALATSAHEVAAAAADPDLSALSTALEAVALAAAGRPRAREAARALDEEAASSESYYRRLGATWALAAALGVDDPGAAADRLTAWLETAGTAPGRRRTVFEGRLLRDLHRLRAGDPGADPALRRLAAEAEAAGHQPVALAAAAALDHPAAGD